MPEEIKNTLEDSIEKAIASESGEKDTSEEKVETTETKAPETKVEEKAAVDAATADMSDEERANAIQLWKSLKDPATSPAVIRFIAEQNGYVPPSKEPQTEKQLEVQENKVKSILLKYLGDDMAWLVEKLGPAIEETTRELTKESVKDLREKESIRENQKNYEEGEKAFVALAQEFFGKPDASLLPEKVCNRMNQLMDELPPSSSMTPQTYIKYLFRIAASETGLTPSKATSDGKVARNRTDASVRLSSEKGGKAPSVVSAPKTKGLDAAVRAALEAVNAE